MFPFLTLFIIFLVILTYYRKKSTRAQEEAQEKFWNAEREANSTRRKDISNLPYINIPVDDLPLDLETEACQTIRSLSSEKIISFGGMTNTQLKLEYGVANLDALSKYESNYIQLEKSLEIYAKELIDANRLVDAQTILEFAVSCGADISNIYLMLANVYQSLGTKDKISGLKDSATQLPELTRDLTIHKLEDFLI